MTSDPGSSSTREDDHLVARVESLAAWLHEIESRVRATELSTGDEGTAHELRLAIEALAKHDPKRDELLTDRIEVLADRLRTLGQTVATTAAGLAGKDGEIANLRRELEAGNQRIERIVSELREATPSAALDELRQAVDALSKSRSAPGSDGLEPLNGKIDFLTERLDTLAKTVATTASGLAGREGELASLRRRLEEDNLRVASAIAELRQTSGHDGLGERVEALARAVAATVDRLTDRETEVGTLRGLLEQGNARVDSVVVELRDSIAALGAQVEALGARAPLTDAPAFTGQAGVLNEKVEALGRQLEALASTVESAAGGISERESELAALHQHVLAASGRVDAVVDELRRSVDSLADRTGTDPGLSNRLDVLSREVHVVTAHLLEVETETEARRRESEARAAELDALLHAVQTRLFAVEQDRDATAAEVQRTAESWAEERVWVRGQLEELAQAIASATKSAPGGTSESLIELIGRLERVEHDGAGLAAEIGRLAALWSSELGSLEARIGEGTVHDERLAALAERLEAMERDRGVVGSTRQDEELVQLRVLFDGLRMRLASSEKEIAALSGSRDVVARLDELTYRLDELGAPDGAAASPPAMTEGDGRFRLELRKLDLRLDQIEALAHENHTAVLLQLERLASRFDWRLQRLESGQHATAPAQPGQAGGETGQVVPFRAREV